MWHKNPKVWGAAAAVLVVAAGASGYWLWSRGMFERDDSRDVAVSPSQVRQNVARKTQRLTVGAILDYADVHGTEMAQAVNRLRKHSDSTDAMTEALMQHEVLGALLDELKARQDAAAD